jgi:hypothetical protein
VQIQGGTCLLNRGNVLRCCVHIHCQPLTGLDLNGRGPDPGGLLLHPRGARDTTHQCAVVSDWRGHGAPVTGVTPTLSSDRIPPPGHSRVPPGPVLDRWRACIESELGLRHSCTITKHNCFPKYRMSGCFQLHLKLGVVRVAERLSHAVACHTGKYTTATNGPLPQSGPPSPLRPVNACLVWSRSGFNPADVHACCLCLHRRQRRPLPLPTLARHTYESRTDVCVRTYGSATEHLMMQRHALGLADALYP